MREVQNTMMDLLKEFRDKDRAAEIEKFLENRLYRAENEYSTIPSTSTHPRPTIPAPPTPIIAPVRQEETKDAWEPRTEEEPERKNPFLGPVIVIFPLFFYSSFFQVHKEDKN
jgi:hypothetical protein